MSEEQERPRAQGWQVDALVSAFRNLGGYQHGLFGTAAYDVKTG